MNHAPHFRAMTPTAARYLWSAAVGDELWPPTFQPLPNWIRAVADWQMAETLGDGALRTIRIHGCLAGFVTYKLADPRFLPDRATAAEVGTYLLGPHRGTGLNRRVKRAWLQSLFARTTADDCLFVVQASNQRAIRALFHLGMEIECATPADDSPYSAYAKRMSWECGNQCHVYSVHRTEYYRWAGLSCT